MGPVRTWMAGLLVLVSFTATAQTTTDSSLVMTDGVHIETTLVLPPDSTKPAGGFPVVVFIHGLGGNKDELSLINTIITGNGFACFTYSVRGQGTSGGLSTIMGPRELQDMRDIITYVRTRPGINPDALGVAGGSQGGVHAWLAAINRIPGVRCIATLVAPPSYASDLAPNNCIKQQLQAELTLSTVRFDPYRDRIRSFVLTENLDSIHAFTKECDLAAYVDSVRIPVIQSVGWKDVLFQVNGAIRARANLASRGIPCWSYFGTNGHSEPLNLQEYFFVIQGMLDWFHHWLIAPVLTDLTTPWVTYADDSPGWPHRMTAVWPPEHASTLRLYPRPHGAGPALAGDLDTSPASGESVFPFTLTYDSTYAPARAWSEGYSGSAFTSAFASKAVRFRSPALTDTLDITGIPHARMVLRGDGRPFQANVRLFDVSPESGGAETWTLLTHMPLGVRSGNSSSNAGYDAEGDALSHKIPPGHIIGIEINSLDMWDADRAHIIPYFRSSSAFMTVTWPGNTYFDIPVVGSAKFVTSAAEPAPTLPAAFVLHQNFPNPFNPSTTIRFDLAAAQDVRLEVFNVAGQRVATLVDGMIPAGSHAVPFHARDLASGLYYCRLITAAGGTVRPMVLLR
jgi:predicted acyl esterase